MVVLLIDGSSFCYRAFYAVRDLRNSKGEPTNAIYGFLTMLKRLIREQEPSYVGVCFDRKEPEMANYPSDTGCASTEC